MYLYCFSFPVPSHVPQVKVLSTTANSVLLELPQSRERAIARGSWDILNFTHFPQNLIGKYPE